MTYKYANDILKAHITRFLRNTWSVTKLIDFIDKTNPIVGLNLTITRPDSESVLRLLLLELNQRCMNMCGLTKHCFKHLVLAATHTQKPHVHLTPSNRTNLLSDPLSHSECLCIIENHYVKHLAFSREPFVCPGEETLRQAWVLHLIICLSLVRTLCNLTDTIKDI